MKLLKIVIWMSLLLWTVLLVVPSVEGVERFATRYPEKWIKTNNEIPYKLKAKDFTEDQWLKITRTINYFNQLSCVKFVPIEPGSSEPEDYISIHKSTTRCSAYSGFKGGEQRLQVLDQCLAPKGEDYVAINLIHELLHALGFIHEHQRPERDEFLHILFENIKPKKRRQFYRYVDMVLNSVTEFDKNSIMMYSERAHSNNGSRTIELVNGTTEILGQRNYLTELDRTKINLAYGCEHFHCSDPMDQDSNMTYLVSSKYAQTCNGSQEGQRMLGSQIRRCLYGNIWSGIKASCVPQNQVLKHCNFEQDCEDFLPENDHWERSQVFPLMVARLEGDLSLGSHSGHVMVFEVGPENPRNWNEIPTHQLRSDFIPLDCEATPSETGFHFCISFGHFTSNSKLQFRLYALKGFKGRRLVVFDSYEDGKSTKLVNEWRYDVIKMSFERCERKLWLEFEVYVPAGENPQFEKAQLVALDEVAVHRDGLC